MISLKSIDNKNTSKNSAPAPIGSVYTSANNTSTFAGNIIINGDTTNFGKTTIEGSIMLNRKKIYIGTINDDAHSLAYNGTINGPELMGYSGGALSTQIRGDILRWDPFGVSIRSLWVYGLTNLNQLQNKFLINTFSTTPSFDMKSGMVYYLATNSTALSSLSFTNIPLTPQSTYIFTFVLLPSTVSSPWYLKPPTNFITITPDGGTTNNAVPIYGLQTTNFPASYTYLLQTITIVNVSTSTTPSYISFSSVSAY